MAEQAAGVSDVVVIGVEKKPGIENCASPSGCVILRSALAVDMRGGRGMTELRIQPP